uniref:Protein tyrosine phosphatase n=1 Tax=Ganoderma boninense TaxID=34458 RepID=A0A5K1K2M5_9APHY|nr:Protein tyrosine phosphatase [Ganoderma boninense]
MFACVDGGFTGASLSCVSKSVRHLSSATRFRSVALCSGSAAEITAFLDLFTPQRRLAAHPTPTIKHLYISLPFFKDLPGAPEALAKEEASFMRGISSLLRLVAPHLETLCLVRCVDTPSATDFILPATSSPTADDKLVFPDLRELMLVGSGLVHGGCVDIAVFPRLTHLQLVATVMELTSWLILAPNLTHMRVTDHDQYAARQVVRSTLMHAARRVLGGPLDFKLPRAYAPETVYVLMGGGLGLGPVLRWYEPRVIRAESDWAGVMKREWQERVGGGLGCWAAVSEHRA